MHQSKRKEDLEIKRKPRRRTRRMNERREEDANAWVKCRRCRNALSICPTPNIHFSVFFPFDFSRADRPSCATSGFFFPEEDGSATGSGYYYYYYYYY